MRLKRILAIVFAVVLFVALVYVSLCFGFTLRKALTQPHLSSEVRDYQFFGYYYLSIILGGLWILLAGSFSAVVIFSKKRL